MDEPLYSTRAGRVRELSYHDFVKLLWRSVIVPIRENGFFAQTLSGQFEDADAFLLDRLNTSDITAHDLLVETDGPGGFMSPDQDVLFDALELLYRDCVSAPASRTITDSGETHFELPFNQAKAQQDFRDHLNPILARHSPPLEMRPNGQIIELSAPAIQTLVDEPIPASVEPALREPIEAAIDRFYRRGATDVDRGDALRHLSNFLEHQRPAIKAEMLSKDENALFEIANGFSIRHHNRGQQNDYDKGIWQEWIFHVYLATAKALIHLAQRDQAAD